MLLILFPSLAAGAVNECAENSMAFVWNAPFPPLNRPPSAVASNPIFEVTSSPTSPSKQVTGPVVAMVTSHSQSQDRGDGEARGGGGGGGRGRGGGRGGGEARLQSRGRLNHIQHQFDCTQAISYSLQHFCNTRFNLAVILINAVYQGEERTI